MEKFGHIITKQIYSSNTKDKRQKTKVSKAFVKDSKVESIKRAVKCDIALEDFEDLIDPKYKEWVCKCYYELGETKFRKIAGECRLEAKKSAKNLFGWSLKKEMLKKTLDK